MIDFTFDHPVLLVLIIVFLVVAFVFVGSASRNYFESKKTEIIPGVPGLKPTEITIVRTKSFFRSVTISYHKDCVSGEEEIKTDESFFKNDKFSANYDPERGVIYIEDNDHVLSYSKDAKTWIAIKNGSDYPVPPDNAFLKEKIAEAEELRKYAYNKFRNILIEAGAMGAEKEEETKTSNSLSLEKKS